MIYVIDPGTGSTTADLVRDTRLAVGFSQTELAERLGTTQSAVSRWECGHDEPRLSTLAAILRSCGRRLRLQAELDDVDRAQIREHLAMSPSERLAAVANVSRLLAGARRVG